MVKYFDRFMSADSAIVPITKMFAQSVKRFQKLEEGGEFGKAGDVIDNLSARLNPRLFIPRSGEYSQGYLKTMISSLIPYVAHRDTGIRTKVSNFLNHWLAVATSFCPKEVIKACTSDERLMYPAAGQAILLTWFAHAISTVPRSEQAGYAKLCQSMAFHSTAVTLKDVPMKFWAFMRIHLSVNELNEVLLPLSHPDLAQAAAFICRKSMIVMAKSVLAIASMEFVAKFIAALRKGEDRIDATVVCERVANSLQESDSSVVSSGIEVLIQLLNFLWWNPSQEEVMFLTPLCYTMRRLVDTESTLCVHRAGCIEALVTCSSHGVVAIDEVLPFISFKADEPAPIQMACLRVSFMLLVRKEMHQDIFAFYDTVTRERDPILFPEFLELFAQNYSLLRAVDEELAFTLLNHCVSPVPTYYVEQLRLIWLLKAIPLTDLNSGRLCMRPEMIAYEFVKKPTPQVVSELKSLFDYLHLEVGVNQLSWFDDSVALSLELVSNLDPHMILELLDIGQVGPSCLVSCLEVLKANPGMCSAHCMGQCLALLNIMMDVLGIRRYVGAKKYPFGSDDKFVLWLSRDVVHGLFRLMSSLIVESGFGQLFHAVCSAICAYLPLVGLSSSEYSELIDVMISVNFTFCETSCTTLLAINQALKATTDEQVMKKRNKLLGKIHSGCEKFLLSEMTDDLPAVIAVIQVLGIELCVKHKEEIVVAAAAKSRDVASLVVESGVEMMLPFMPTFLSFVGHQSSEWIDQCKEKFPFNDWILASGDENIIYPEELQNVDQASLDVEHRLMVEKVLGRKEEQVQEATFEYQEPQLEKGIQMHKGSGDSLYDVTSFLWHSTMPPPVALEELESFCLSHIHDTRLSLGFLAYTHVRGLKINVDEWMKHLPFCPSDIYSYFAIIQLLSFINCHWEEMPPTIKEFLTRICAKLDVNDLDPEMIAHQYSAREDIEKELFHAIMSIDKSTYQHIFALDSDDGKKEQFGMLLNTMEMALNEISICATFQKLVTILFDESSFAESPRILAPRGLKLPKFYMKFDDLIQQQTPPKLADDQLSALLGALQQNLANPDVIITPDLLSIFVHLDLSTEAVTSFIKLVEERAFGDKLFLAVLANNHASADAISDFFLSRPPSTSRAFFRITRLSNLPNASQIWQDQAIHKAMKPVHPGFGYFAMGPKGIPVNGEPIPLDQVRYGTCSTASVLEQLKIVTCETVDLFYSLTRVLDVDPDLFPDEDALLTRINASGVVGGLMNKKESTLVLLCKLFDVLVQSLGIEPLSVLFCSRDFFNSENFLATCVLFHKFERYVNEKKDDERIEMCRLFREPESCIFADTTRITVFNECVGSEDLVSSLLKQSFVK